MNKKATITIIALALVLACVVGGMVAYLTSEDEVTNTFTVGKVKITLDEAPVDVDGKAVDGDRVKANKYKLIPGQEYDKDPTVHVAASSDNCWVFVKVENEIAGIEGDTKIADQMAANGWTLVSGTTNVYAYEDVAEAGQDLPVFETFTVSGDVKDLTDYENTTVTVKAYAVQATGFGTAAAAWDATFGK